jgi:hypothetical protein
MHVTEEELRELAGSGEGRAGVVARLVELVPSEAEGELSTVKSGPVPVDRSELEALQRGERPEGLAEKLAATSAPDRPNAGSRSAPEGPTRKPPQARTGEEAR